MPPVELIEYADYLRERHREAGWARCRDLARDTDVEYRMWSRSDYPTWSMPALDAAKCVALQGQDLFEAVRLALYRAFFTDGVNIGRAIPTVVAPDGRRLIGAVSLAEYRRVLGV
jgi:predicted DsbA family dithiol-disulfide isomerase